MTKYSNVSYSVVSKEDDKQFNSTSNRRILDVYNFEHFKIIKFYTEGRWRVEGEHNTIEKAVEELVTSFKDLKSKEFDASLDWAKKQYKKKILNKNDLMYFESLITTLKNNIDQDSGLNSRALMEIIVQNTPKGELGLSSFLGIKTYKKYKEHGQMLFEKSKQVKKFTEETKQYLTSGKELLNQNKKILFDIYSKDLFNDFYKNINICLKWCKNPSYLSQPLQNKQLQEVKTNLDDIKLRLEKYQKEKIEEQLLQEKKLNKEITGYFETDDEKISRESREKTEYATFIDNVKKIINLSSNQEIKQIYSQDIVWFDETMNDIVTYSKERFIGLSNDKKESLKNLVSETLKDLSKLEMKISEPNMKIKKFLESPTDKILIIEGMAGSGKTAKIPDIIKFCFDKLNFENKNIIISAPSTVGAANIRQRWRIKTEVFQKLIKPEEILKKKKINLNNEIRLFIVDEANMLTSRQLKSLLVFFSKTKLVKIILLGDSGQINAFDHNSEESEESPALEIQKIVELGESNYTIQKINLTTDYRFMDIESGHDFIKAMKWLREDHPETPIFENFLEKSNYPNSEVITTLQHKNEIIEHFNKNLSIFDYLHKRMEINQEIDIERLISRFQIKFQKDDIKKALLEYKNPENRRPELGQIYSKLFPSIKERIQKPEEVDSSIILRRSNEGVVDSNIAIRPHLFNDSKDELAELMIGELLFIKKVPDNLKKRSLLTNIEDGDLVIVTKIYESETHNDKRITKVGVKPVIKRLNSWSQKVVEELDKLQKFLNLNISLLSERSITVWHGNLAEKDDFKNWNDYVKLRASRSSKEDLWSSPCLVTYGYTRTMFTAQGGDWENVFIHQGDMWGYSTNEQKKYLYTAVSRTYGKVFFSN